MPTERRVRLTSLSNNGGSAAIGSSAANGNPSSRNSETSNRQSKKELDKLRKKKESLYGIEVAEKLKKEGIFTNLAGHLESLPRQIATYIADQANAMLELVTEIQTKSTPLALFGTKVKKKNGEEVDYIPKCIREIMKTNPVSGSNRIKDHSDEYKTIVSQFDSLISLFKTDGTNLLKRCAELEVSERKKLLQREALQTIADLSVNFVIYERRKLPPNPDNAGPNLSTTGLGWKAAHRYIHTFNAARRTQLHFNSSDEVGPLFNELKEKADVRIGNIELNDVDNSIINAVVTKVSTLFPFMSFDVWDSLSEDETIRAINQDLLVEYSKKKQGQVNEDTQEVVTGTVGIDQSTMRTLVREEALSIIRKEKSKTERAKYSGGPQNQGPPGTNAGRNSSKGKGNSNANAKKPGEKKVKKKQQQQPKHKQKQKQSHKQQQQQQSKKKRRGKKQRDDQDEVSSVKRGRQRQRR